MTVKEYSIKVNKTVEKILNLCKKLGIKVKDENSILSDDNIALLDYELDEDEKLNSGSGGGDSNTGSDDGGIDIDFECLATGSAKLNNFVSDGGSLSVLMFSLNGIGNKDGIEPEYLTTSSTNTDNCFKCCSDLVKKVENIKASYAKFNADIALLFAYYDGDFLDENGYIDVDGLNSHIDSHRGINGKFASNILEQAGLVNESTFFTSVFGSDKYLQENGLLDIDLIESDRLLYGIGNSLNYMTLISGSNELAKGLSNGDFNDENGRLDVGKFYKAKDRVFGDLDEEYAKRGDFLTTIYGLESIVNEQSSQNALCTYYERELNIAKQELEALGAQKDYSQWSTNFNYQLTGNVGDLSSNFGLSEQYGKQLEKVADLEGKLAEANMNYYSLYSLYPNFSELNFNETKIADYKVVMEKNDLPVDFSGVPFAKDSVSIFDKIVYYDKDGNEIKNVSDFEAAKFFVENEKNGNDVSDVLDNLDFVSFKDAYNVYKYLDYVVDPIYTVENKKDTSNINNMSEKNIVNYLFNTGNNAQVEAYLKSMKSFTDNRQGVEQAAEVMKKIENYENIAALKAEMNGTEITSVNFSNIWNNAVNYSNSGNVQSNYIDVSQGIGTILAAEGFVDGVKTHFNGLFNLMNADGVVDVDTYKVSSLVTALNNKYGAGVIDSVLGTNSFGNIFSGVYENFNSIGNMAPTILAGYVGGFLGVPVLGSISMGMSIAGNTVDQAKAEGMTSLEAWTYGVLSGASEGITGQFLGAIPGLKQAYNMSDRLGNLFGGNPMMSYLAKMFSEGVEESTQSVLEPLLYNIVTGRPAKSIDIVDVAKSGIHGAITAGFLSSGTLVIDSYRYSLMDIPTKELVSIMNKYEGRDLTKDSVIKKLKTDLEKYRIKYDVDDASLIELNYHFKHDKQFKHVRDKFDPLNVISAKIDMDNLKKYYAKVDMTQQKNLEKFEFDIEFYQDLYGIEVDKNEILSSLNSEVLTEDNSGQFTKINVDDILELNSRMQGENSTVDRQLLELLVNEANESSLNSQGKILQLAYNIVEKNVFGSQSKSMAMLVVMQNLKINGIESSIDPNVLTSFISGIGTIGLSQEHLLMIANKSDLSIDDAMKFSNITEDGLNDTNRDVVLSQAIKNYLDSLIKEARKFCNISNEDSLQNDNINKYLNENKANSDKNIDESYYENYSKNNRENAVPIEENIGGLITTKIRTDFKNISQEEKRVISKFLNKDSKDITVEDYKRYLDVNKVLKKLFKNVPKGFDIKDEKFLFGISDKSEIDDNILKKTIYESVKNGSSLVDIIAKIIGNNQELVSEIGLYTLIDAMNQYAYKYLEDNNISLEKGKLPIEMLAAKDPEFYDGTYEDFAYVLEQPLTAADDSYSLATGKLVNIVKKVKGSLLGYNDGMEGRIPHSTKTKDSAIRKVYNDWVSDLENNGYRLNDMKNPKNDSGEYVLVGINENNKGQIFTINRDGFVIDSDGNVVSNYTFKLEKYIPNDLLRYTIVSDGKNYVSTVASTLIGLEKQGIKILKAKFSWPGSFYQGINLTLQIGNQNFELQIHTNESFYAKDDATHMFYEIVRNKIFNDGDNRSSVQKNADYAQVLMQMQVEVPQNAEKFKLISTFIEVAIGINKNISSNKMNEIMEFLNNLENKGLDKNSQKRLIGEFIESIAGNEEFSLGNFLIDYFELTENDMMSFMDKYAVSISNDGTISPDIQKIFIEDFLASGLSLREIFQIDWISEYYNESNIMSFFDGMSNLDIFKILFKGDNLSFIIEKFGKNGSNLLINLINQGNVNVLYNSVISSEPYFSGMSNKQALFNLIKLFNQLMGLGIDFSSINMDSSLINFYELYNSKRIISDDATMKFVEFILFDKSSLVVEGKDVSIADQGSIRKAFKDFKLSLAERIEQKKLQSKLINQVVKNFTVDGVQLVSKKEAVEFLQRLDLGINNGGTGGLCSYADVAKLIFEMFDGKEIEFEEKFGFSMYTDGRLNQEQLIVDLFTKINDYEYIKKIANDTNFDGSKAKVLASAAVNEKCYDVEIIYDYLVNKVGFDIDKSQLVPRNIYSNFKSNGKRMSQQEIRYNANETLSMVNAAINNGEHVSISCRVATRYEDGKRVKSSDKNYAPIFELIDINGNVRKIDSNHIMPIRGIDANGRLVVETWDQLFYVDIEYALSKGMQFSINSVSVNGKSVVPNLTEVSEGVVEQKNFDDDAPEILVVEEDGEIISGDSDNQDVLIDENMYASYNDESSYGVDQVVKSDIDYVIRTHNSRYYKNQDALDRLRRFSNPDDINYGNYNLITSTGNARNILMKYTPQQIRNYINQLDANDQKQRRIVNQQSNVSNNHNSKLSSYRNFFEYIYSNSRNNIIHSLDSLVKDFVLGDLNGSKLYGILVDFGSVMKKVPSRGSYVSYLNELRRLGCDIKAQSRDRNGNKDYERNQFNHVFSSNWRNIDPTQRLYFHAEYEDTFTFLKSFAAKCNERGIPFYFKTADFEFDGRRSFIAYQSSLTRTESAVIYSTDEYMMQYIDICNEIKNEHPEIKFYNPTIGLAVLDNWLGYGGQPDVNLCENKGVSASFNAVRARVLELSIKQGLKKFVNSYGSNIVYGNKTVDNLLTDSLFNYVVSVNHINSDNERNKLYKMLTLNKEFYLGQLKQDVSSIKVGNYVVHDVSKVRGYMYAAYCSDNDVILKLISDSMRDVCVEYDVDPDNFAFNLSDKKRMQMLSDKLRQHPNDVKVIADIKYIIESHDKKYFSGDALYRLKQFSDPRSDQYGNYNMISSNMGARNVLKNYTPEDIAKYLSRFDGRMMSNNGYELKDGDGLRSRMGIQFFANKNKSNIDRSSIIDENMYASDSDLTVVNNNQLSVNVNSFVKLDGRAVINRILFTKESVNELFVSINESRYYSSQYSKEEVLFGLVRAFNEESYYVSLFAENNPIASEFISLYYENKSSLTSDQAIYDFVNKYVVDKTIPGSKVRLDQFSLLDMLSPFNRNKYGVNTLRSNLISHLSSKIDIVNKKVLYSVLRGIESSRVLTGISGYKKYSLISQYIFDMYKGQEGRFERDFGFPMYLDGGLNNIQLQLDMLISIHGKQFDGKSLKQILDDRNNGKISFEYDDKSVVDYLINRGIITSEEALVQETLFDTRKDFEYKNIKDVVNNLLIRIDELLSNGNKVMLSLSSETDVYGNMINIRDENGNIISRVLNGNSINILGISSDGKLIVELSGRSGYIDLENELIFGKRFSIDSLHLEVNNLLDVGIEDKTLGMERLDLGNVSFGEIERKELKDLVKNEDGSPAIDENMYASEDSQTSKNNNLGLYKIRLAIGGYVLDQSTPRYLRSNIDMILGSLKNVKNNIHIENIMRYGDLSILNDDQLIEIIKVYMKQDCDFKLPEIFINNKKLIIYIFDNFKSIGYKSINSVIEQLDYTVLSSVELNKVINIIENETDYKFNYVVPYGFEKSSILMMRTIRNGKYDQIEHMLYHNLDLSILTESEFDEFIEKLKSKKIRIDNNIANDIIRSNIDLIMSDINSSKYIRRNLQDTLFSLLNEGKITNSQMKNIIKYAFDNNYTDDLRLEMVKYIISNFSDDYGVMKKLVNSFDYSSISDELLNILLGVMDGKGNYVFNLKTPFDLFDSIVSSVVSEKIELLSIDYRDKLLKIINDIGFSPLYVYGFDGLFSERVIDTFGVAGVVEIFRYSVINNNEVNIQELVINGQFDNFVYLYNKLFDVNVLGNKFDIIYFNNFVNKYVKYFEIFNEVINGGLKDSDINLLKLFVRSNYDVEISSYEDLLNYKNIIKKYILNIFDNGDINQLRDVITIMLLNQKYDDTIDVFEQFIDSEKAMNLSNNINDKLSKVILNHYSNLFKVMEDILSISDNYDKLLEFAKSLYLKLDSRNFEFRYFDDVFRYVKYYYGLELQQGLSSLENILSNEVNFKEEVLLVEKLDDGSEVRKNIPLIKVSSKYRLMQHTMNAYAQGGKISYFKHPKLIGKSYICLSLIGNGKFGVADTTNYTKYDDMDHVTLLFDRNAINPKNFVYCSHDNYRVNGSNNSLDVSYVYKPNFDVMENILDKTSNGWNEYTFYRDGMYPTGVLYTGRNSEVEAANYLGVPLIHLNHFTDAILDDMYSLSNIKLNKDSSPSIDENMYASEDSDLDYYDDSLFYDDNVSVDENMYASEDSDLNYYDDSMFYDDDDEIDKKIYTSEDYNIYFEL